MNKRQLHNFLTFLHEAEGLKRLLRHSWLSNRRRESVAEHSWRLALMVMVLAPQMEKTVDILKVLKMVTIHDLCEVFGGDYWAFKKEKLDKYEIEKAGLLKILRNLPRDVGKEFMDLWEEFEQCETYEAKLAKAVDKVEVLIQHNEAPLKTWNKKERSRGFNLFYGDDNCRYDVTIKLLKDLVREETDTKLQKNI